MVVQTSPEQYYSNLADELAEKLTPQVKSEPQRMVVSEHSLVDATPMSDADKFLMFGVVAIVGMVALCVIAYYQDKRVKDESNTVQPVV